MEPDDEPDDQDYPDHFEPYGFREQEPDDDGPDDEPQTRTAWVVKYALTIGIFEVLPSSVNDDGWLWSSTGHPKDPYTKGTTRTYKPSEWTWTFDEALAIAHQAKIHEVRKAKKRMDKYKRYAIKYTPLNKEG